MKRSVKTTLIACIFLRASRQAVCRPFSDRFRRLSSLRFGSLPSALLTALLLASRLCAGGNEVVVEVAGYNANSFHLLDQPSFLQAEKAWPKQDGRQVYRLQVPEGYRSDIDNRSGLTLVQEGEIPKD